MEKSTKKYLVLKILGFAMIAIAILLIILGSTVFAWKYSPNPALLALGLMMLPLAFCFIFIGFLPNIKNASMVKLKKIQQQSKGFFEEFIEFSNSINTAPVRKCEYCGSTLDKDAKSCENCGAKQN